MRQEQLIRDARPCDLDFTDKSIQTMSDARAKGPVICINYPICKKRNKQEGLYCICQFAQQFAIFVLNNQNPFHQAVQEERRDLVKELPDGEYWVFREGRWQVVDLKDNVINDIVQFALIIIDRQDSDRRPFTKDGTSILEMGPSDAVHNALLDLDDVYVEVGQKNLFRHM